MRSLHVDKINASPSARFSGEPPWLPPGEQGCISTAGFPLRRQGEGPCSTEAALHSSALDPGMLRPPPWPALPAKVQHFLESLREGLILYFTSAAEGKIYRCPARLQDHDRGLTPLLQYVNSCPADKDWQIEAGVCS